MGIVFKPCPFCGSQDIRIRKLEGRWCCVQCYGCEARSATYLNDDPKHMEKILASIWNMRDRIHIRDRYCELCKEDEDSEHYCRNCINFTWENGADGEDFRCCGLDDQPHGENDTCEDWEGDE